LSYRILVEKRVKKETQKIPHSDREKIDHAILSLALNPRPDGCKKLTEKSGYRIRIGNYRVLYMIDDENKVIIIYRIKFRNEKTYR